MQLTFDDETEAFRREFVTWLEANLPTADEATDRSRSSAHVPDWARDFQRKRFDEGWLIPGNPPEHGGRNAKILEQFVHHQELADRGIYNSFNPQGLGIIVPSLLGFGTPEQVQQWALPILRAEITAALGMSEPGAGSDLAGLRTKAVLADGTFTINGQKVWTSGAHDADVILVFARTDPDAPKHKGISAILVPTDTPGVTRRPFGSVISREELDFNEVFFDDVVVPAENLVGPLHQGWRVANGSLGHERAMLWLGQSSSLVDFLERFRGVLDARPDLRDDDRVLDDYANVAINAQALKLLGMRSLAKARRGIASNEESILKLFGSESSQTALESAVEWLGPDALDHLERTPDQNHLQLDEFQGSWFDRYLRSFAGTIAGGTSEIQRNIVAERVLGLPK